MADARPIPHPRLRDTPIGFNAPVQSSKLPVRCSRTYDAWTQAQAVDPPGRLLMTSERFVPLFDRRASGDKEAVSALWAAFSHRKYMGLLAKHAELVTSANVQGYVIEAVDRRADTISFMLKGQCNRECGLAGRLGLWTALRVDVPDVLRDFYELD